MHSSCEDCMLALAGNPKIFLYNLAADLRKGFEGLSVLAESHFQLSVTNGAYFVFVNRTRDKIKVLYWDVDGLAIWHKRLEKGRFAKKGNHQAMERREFLMMLEGVTPKRIQKRFKMT